MFAALIHRAAEEEARVITDVLEVAVVGRFLLRPGHRTLGAVDIELSER